MKQRIYISGPITGMPNLNKPAFNTAAAQLRAAGFEAVNPIQNGVPDSAPWAAHMREDIKLLMACQGVATLPGTAASRGARLELHIARAIGIPVMTAQQWLAKAEQHTEAEVPA